MRLRPLHPAPSNWPGLFPPPRGSLWVLSLALLWHAQAKEYKYTLEDLELSCYSARMPPRLAFCDMVDWSAATATPKANFSMFTEPVLITNDEQDLAAEEYYKRYATANTRHECLNGLKRLLCAKAFPECPYSGRGEGYFPPCEMFCRQVAEQCSMPIGCSQYPDDNCMVVIPDGYIVLQDKYGPYDSLPAIYGVMLTLWSAGCLLWLFVAIYSNQEYTLPLSKFLSVVPCVKVVVLILAFAFWRTCVQWRMCSYWLGVCVSNSHMVYETVVVGSFLLIAKGWSITTSNLDGNEWRNVATIMCAFYTTDAIIQVMRPTLVATKSFWIATLCLYGVVFYLVLVNVGMQLHKVRQQLKALQRFESPAYLVEPFKAKEFMYRMFLGLVLLFIVGQIVSHGLTMWDHRWWTVLLCYETVDVVVFSVIAWTFRPQEHSPYFFMEETHPRQQEQATRLLPIIEACEAAEEDAECPPSDEEGGRVIELTPFLSRNRSKASQRQLSQRRTDRVVVVRNPDKRVELGVSDKAPASGTTAAAAVPNERPARAVAVNERPVRADAWLDDDHDFGPPPPPPPLPPEPFL